MSTLYKSVFMIICVGTMEARSTTTISDKMTVKEWKEAIKKLNQDAYEAIFNFLKQRDACWELKKSLVNLDEMVDRNFPGGHLLHLLKSLSLEMQEELDHLLKVIKKKTNDSSDLQNKTDREVKANHQSSTLLTIRRQDTLELRTDKFKIEIFSQDLSEISTRINWVKERMEVLSASVDSGL